MHEQLPLARQTIPVKEFSSPQQDELEKALGTPVSAYAYEFGSPDYSCFTSIHTIAEGVVKQMTEARVLENPGFQVVCQENFGNSNRIFSGGILFFGASSRELAEKSQPQFTWGVNSVLEGVGAHFRLAPFNPNLFGGGG